MLKEQGIHMRKLSFFVMFLSAICSGFALADTISFHYLQQWNLGEVRVQLDITIVGDNRIEITVMKEMTPFPEVLLFTTDAEYESGRYIFRTMDGWNNYAFGHIAFEGTERETAIFFLDGENPTGGMGNVGRLYGTTHVMTRGMIFGGRLQRQESFAPGFRPLAPQSARHTIEGVWYPAPSPHGTTDTIGRDLSWGRGIVPNRSSIIIDIHSDPPVLEIFSLPGLAPTVDRIIGIVEEGNRTKLTIYAAWYGEGGLTVIFNFNEDGTMWIEPRSGANAFRWMLGRDWVYYRIDGPEF